MSGVEELHSSLKRLISLEEDLSLANEKKDQLHVRYASIIADIPLFELNIPIELLEDETYSKIEKYFHNLENLVDENTVTLGEKMDLEMSKRKYILQSDLKSVCDILGIVGITDSTYYRQTMTKLIDLHAKIIDLIAGTILNTGNKADYYFGEKFYPKLQGTKFAFSIDEKEDKVYLMNYAVDDDIPSIYELSSPNNTIKEAVRLISISQEDLEFYTRY